MEMTKSLAREWLSQLHSSFEHSSEPFDQVRAAIVRVMIRSAELELIKARKEYD